MFQNSYQNGTHFDFFDPKLNPDKLKPLYKPSNLPANHKVFDKDLKTYVLESASPHAKMVFPRQDRKDLYLIQQYLVLQIYFFPGMAWNIELTLCDLTKTKRRVVLSPATTKAQIKPFFVKMPCHWQEVDLYSFMDAFKGQTYRSLDYILIGGHFKLRRIYTTPHELPELNNEQFFQEVKQVNFLPKQFHLPMGVPSATLLNRYNPNEVSQLISQVESSTKNSSFLKPKTRQNSRPATKTKIQEKPPKKPQYQVKVQEFKTEKSIKEVSKQKPKIQVKQLKKKQDFLANTNVDVLTRKNKDKSIDKNALSQKMTRNRNKSNPKGVNPWRNHKKSEDMSQESHLAVSNHLKMSNRKANTPDNVSSMKKVTRISEMLQTKKTPFDGYSDSEYVELSQKFSTFTDGKFLKSGVNPLEPVEKHDHQDQIQENIELETNSLYESRKVEDKPEHKQHKQVPLIRESINDSLDMLKKSENQNHEQILNIQDQFARSSLYGFGQGLMRNFMQDIHRPYSPPLGQRENKQQQQQLQPGISKQQVELMFDPVLNCYYDYRTHTYYQLKN